MMQTRAAAVLLCSAIAACRSGATNERIGDDAYGEGRFQEALAAYQTAVKSDPAARIWAKIGAAALRVDSLGAAADAYLRVSGEDPTRTEEAAEGLEIVARSAEHSGNIPALQAAVAGLEAVAPERLAGRFTLALARRPESDPADLVALLPGAIAAASDPRTVDSLLAAYAVALRETAGCGTALPVYRAVVRRSHEQSLLDSAGAAIVQCTDTLVLDSLAVPDSTVVDSMGVP